MNWIKENWKAILIGLAIVIAIGGGLFLTGYIKGCIAGKDKAIEEAK